MKKFISLFFCLVFLFGLVPVLDMSAEELEWIVEPTFEYDDVDYFEKNTYVFTQNGKKGLTDNTGKVLIKAAYETFLRCTCGNIYTDKKQHNIITLNNNYTRKSVATENSHTLCYGLYFYSKGKVKVLAVGEKTIARDLSDDTGAVVFERLKLTADKSNGGYDSSKINHTGEYGFRTATGEIVFDEPFENACGFTDGIGAVKRNGKWAYIDENGEYLTDFLYSDTKHTTHLMDKQSVYLVSEGLIPVCRDGKWGYIDRTGKEVVDCVYQKTSAVFDSRAWVKQGGKWGILDLSNVPVSAEEITVNGFLNNDGIYVGNSAKLGYSVEPEAARVQWKSSDEKILTVSEDGIVYFNSIGTAVISACNNKGIVLATLDVTVTESPEEPPVISTAGRNRIAFILCIVFAGLALLCGGFVAAIMIIRKKRATVSSVDEDGLSD